MMDSNGTGTVSARELEALLSLMIHGHRGHGHRGPWASWSMGIVVHGHRGHGHRGPWASWSMGIVVHGRRGPWSWAL